MCEGITGYRWVVDNVIIYDKNRESHKDKNRESHKAHAHLFFVVEMQQQAQQRYSIQAPVTNSFLPKHFL